MCIRDRRDSVLVSALAASWLADRPHGIYDEAVERLLDVRDCIHLVAGKDTNLMPVSYTHLAPNVLNNRGILAEAGANEHNVAMSATETIAVNERAVSYTHLAACPVVRKARSTARL